MEEQNLGERMGRVTIVQSLAAACAALVWLGLAAVAVTRLPETPGVFEEMPAFVVDGAGEAWLAAVARPEREAVIHVYQGWADGRRRLTFRPAGADTVSAPALAARTNGCVLACPVERGDNWRIAVVSVGPESTDDDLNRACILLDAGGTVNMNPALAVVGARICVVWEANARDRRGVYAVWIADGVAGTPERLTPADVSSSNPAVVALPDGRVYAAWDSMRGDNVDLYGRWFDGAWQPEQRLTDDPRLDRHVALAVRQSDVLLAWQSQATGHVNAAGKGRYKINNVDSQQLGVAKLGVNGALTMPAGTPALTGYASDALPRGNKKRSPVTLLLRPRIAVAPDGRVWLTAQRSISRNGFWNTLAWHHDGEAWAAAKVYGKDSNHWCPSPIAFHGNEPRIAITGLPHSSAGGYGKGIDEWPLRVRVTSVAAKLGKPAEITYVPLALGPTTFSLARYVADHSLALPRQQIVHAGRTLTLYWGDLHEHTTMSRCVRNRNPPPDDLYANLRDIDRLDFGALTDHGFDLTKRTWAYTGELARLYHDPGRFVAMLGQEYTSHQIGHRNLVFCDTRYHQSFYGENKRDIRPVWKRLEADGAEFVTIPHGLADLQYGRLVDWSLIHEHHQPLAEIYQARQSYEYYGCPEQAPHGEPKAGHYLQDAWAQGVVIGVIASPDHGGSSGRAGIWAEALTRDALFKAFHARHSFGTSGAKIAMLLASGEALMGDKVVRDAPTPIAFKGWVRTTKPIKEVVIFGNNQILQRVAGDGKQELDIAWTDAKPPNEARLWYYMRAEREDGELAWTSPIWFLAGTEQ